jgi:GTP-binding protein Era
MKSGFISIIGKTNAGKSTLINLIVKEKISIATSKPQSTRNAIQGIYNDDESQIVFIDTPGILIPHQKLDKFMLKEAYSSLEGIDGLIFLVDGSVPFSQEKDQPIIASLKKVECPLFIVFNKIDLTNIFLINSLKKIYQEAFPQAKLIEISCYKNVNIDLLLKEIKNVLNEGYAFYPENMKSDHPLSFLIGEIIREKVLIYLQEEVPHCIAIKIEKMENINDILTIYATIICEKESQKGIIIGKGGKMLKKIGMSARKDIEKMMNRQINLKTFVRVEEKWRDSSSYLKEFGYSDENK